MHYSGTACCNKYELSKSRIVPSRISFIIYRHKTFLQTITVEAQEMPSCCPSVVICYQGSFSDLLSDGASFRARHQILEKGSSITDVWVCLDGVVQISPSIPISTPIQKTVDYKSVHFLQFGGFRVTLPGTHTFVSHSWQSMSTWNQFHILPIDFY